MTLSLRTPNSTSLKGSNIKDKFTKLNENEECEGPTDNEGPANSEGPAAIDDKTDDKSDSSSSSANAASTSNQTAVEDGPGEEPGTEIAKNDKGYGNFVKQNGESFYKYLIREFSTAKFKHIFKRSIAMGLGVQGKSEDRNLDRCSAEAGDEGEREEERKMIEIGA